MVEQNSVLVLTGVVGPADAELGDLGVQERFAVMLELGLGDLLTVAEVEQVTEAVERTVPGADVADIERSADLGAAYEVEVVDRHRIAWRLQLSEDFAVVGAAAA